MFTFSVVMSALIFTAPAPGTKTQPANWVGKTVMLKATGVTLNRIDEKGLEVPLEELTELAYHVLAERADRVQLKSRKGTLGWVRKSELVELADAPAHFTERIQGNADDSDAYNRRAWAWRLRGELDAAIKDLGESLRLNPDAAIYNNRAAVWHAKQDFKRAIDDYSEAIKLNPQFVLPYFNRGIAWEAQKEYDKAIEDYTEAIKLDPKYVNAFRNRGYVHHLKKEFDQAIQDYGEALRIDPGDVSALTERGNTHNEKKDYDKAIADFSEALRLDPKFIYAVYNRARSWDGKKDYGKAIADYSEAIRIDPRYVYAYWGRAATRTRKQEYLNASADYNEAMRLDPKNGGLCNAAAWLLATCPDAKARDGKRAVELAKRAVALNPKDINAVDTLAAAHAEAGAFDEAVRLQERVLQDTLFQNNEAARQRLELYRKKLPYREK